MTNFWSKAAAEAAQSQARCDSIQAEFRAEAPARRSIRRDPPPAPLALVPSEDPLKLRLAEELEYARRMLEALGERLSSDGLIVSRHMVALQSVDIVGQMLSHIASVVASSDPHGAVERIGMSDLKSRLTRKNLL
jgi:hypothetical protein